MKKLLIVLLILCLAGVVLAGCFADREPSALPEEEVPAPETTADEGEISTPAQEEAEGIDFDVIYALHQPDEVVLTIDGEEVLWEDYYYFYRNQALQLDDQFTQMQANGYAMGWDSAADEEGHSYAELLPEAVERNLRQVLTIEAVAREEGIQLEDSDEEVQAEHQDNILYFCGEDGTEDQLFEKLKEIHLRPELYWRLVRVNHLSQDIYRQLYGENGEKLEDQQVLDWMEANGILSANHILIGTTGLEEEQVAEKLAQAQELAAELQAIVDPAVREARFLELKEQYCEDGGDYVFGEGIMEPAFYDGTAALEIGQVSDPVETPYGYHIILRRALHAEDEIFSGYTAQPARSMAGSGLFTQRMQQKMDAQKVVPAEGFAAPQILDYYTKPTYTE